MLLKILIIVAILTTLGIVALGVHRLAISLEERGYIYYREKPKSGAAAGALRELDGLVRPNTRHVVEAEENLYAKESEEQGADP